MADSEMPAVDPAEAFVRWAEEKDRRTPAQMLSSYEVGQGRRKVREALALLARSAARGAAPGYTLAELAQLVEYHHSNAEDVGVLARFLLLLHHREVLAGRRPAEIGALHSLGPDTPAGWVAQEEEWARQQRERKAELNKRRQSNGRYGGGRDNPE